MAGAIINEFLNQRRRKPINTGETDIAWHFNEDDKRRLRNLRRTREKNPGGLESHERVQVWMRESGPLFPQRIALSCDGY